ncbi:MAG: hypothetical protein IJ087_17810 [Eggerthellaceae bacterium]|nr:hypothetical protein [Eggerthellaceae bacterium]
MDSRGRYRGTSNMSDDGLIGQYKELAARVIEKATNDYVTTLLKIMRLRKRACSGGESVTRELNYATGRRLELERFFRGGYFQTLCSKEIDGQEVIDVLRKRVGFTL